MIVLTAVLTVDKDSFVIGNDNNDEYDDHYNYMAICDCYIIDK